MQLFGSVSQTQTRRQMVLWEEETKKRREVLEGSIDGLNTSLYRTWMKRQIQGFKSRLILLFTPTLKSAKFESVSTKRQEVF